MLSNYLYTYRRAWYFDIRNLNSTNKIKDEVNISSGHRKEAFTMMTNHRKTNVFISKNVTLPCGGHLAMKTAGEHLPPFSLVRSSSISFPSRQIVLLLTLCSELAVLLVARGESETPTVLLLVGPDLTYTDKAGTFVLDDLKLLGTLRLISCISKYI